MKERASGLRRLPVSAWVFDTVLALAAAGISTAYFVSEPMARGLPRGTLALGYGLALLHTLPLAARRRFPGTVLALILASGLAFAAVSLPPFFLGPAILVAVYSVAAYGSRSVALAGLGWPPASTRPRARPSPRRGPKGGPTEPELPVADLEGRDPVADRLDLTGELGAEDRPPRSPEPAGTAGRSTAWPPAGRSRCGSPWSRAP
jgi:hypothetical protein